MPLTLRSAADLLGEPFLDALNSRARNLWGALKTLQTFAERTGNRDELAHLLDRMQTASNSLFDIEKHLRAGHIHELTKGELIELEARTVWAIDISIQQHTVQHPELANLTNRTNRIARDLFLLGRSRPDHPHWLKWRTDTDPRELPKPELTTPA